MSDLGLTLGRYRLIRRLGAGGMGVVYLAEDVQLRREVVVKTLRDELARDREQVERFFNEARAAARLAHPGIVDVLDVAIAADGPAYLVMELLAGESLGARLRRDPLVSSEIAVAIVRQAALAVAAAHAHGIVHRDLKPDNLFLVPDPEIAIGLRVKVLDFGLAKLLDDELAGGVRTRTGELIGTPLYMAPEQCRGAEAVDHRADIYALGCIAYELVCGRPPFVATGLGDLLIAHQTEAPVAPRERAAAVSPALDQIIVRALAKKPWERQPSCQQLADELGALAVTASTRRERHHARIAPPIGVEADAATVATRIGAPPAAPDPTLAVVRQPRSRWWVAALAVIALGTTVAAALAIRAHDRDAAVAAPPDADTVPEGNYTADQLAAMCDARNALACRYLGALFHGIGRATEALAADHRGCTLGDWRACAQAAELLRTGVGTVADPAAAAALDRSACDHDDATGCAQLGAALIGGHGVALDVTAGLTALERSCTLDAKIGCGALAGAVARGLGAAPDPARAHELYRRACTAGDAGACGK